MITDAAPPRARPDDGPGPSDRPRVPALATRGLVEVVAAFAAVVGPATNAAVSPANRWWVIVGVGVAASLVLALLPERWWIVRAAVIVATGAALERAEGPMLGAWVALGLLLTDWAVRRRRWGRLVPAPDPVAGVGVVALLLLAARRATDINAGGRPLILVAAALVLAAIGAFTGDLLTRAVVAARDGARALGRRGRTDAEALLDRRRELARAMPTAPSDAPSWQEVPGMPAPRPHLHIPVWVPVAVLGALAVHRVVSSGWGWRAAVLLLGAAGFVVCDLVDPTLVPRLLRRAGQAIGHVLGRLAFMAIGLLLLPVPWAAQRLLRVDPLGPRVAPGTTWAERARMATSPHHPWGVDTVAVRPPRWYRIRRSVGVPVLVGAAVVVLLAQQAGLFQALRARYQEPPIPAAYADDPWYPDHREDLAWILDESDGVELGLPSTSGAWLPFRPQRVVDVRTRTVNVTDGVRAGWSPPCDCEPIVVWMFGGSTTFGIGQRDEHTIASELARAAWAAGVAVEVRNWGVPGDIHRGEAQRLAWELAGDDPRPDLVVFYDGANEEWATGTLRTEADLDDAVDPLSEVMYDDLRPGRLTDPPTGATVLGSPQLGQLAPEEEARITVERYERARVLSRDLAEAEDLPIRWFWQPVRADRPAVGGEPAWDPDTEERLATRRDEMRRLLDDEVIDVSAALDDVTEPTYGDGVHHDEDGARIVAAALYDALAADLAALADGEEIDR